MARTYSAPIFNLTCNVWRQELGSDVTTWPNTRPARSADLTPTCQLYLQQKAGGEFSVHDVAGGTFFPTAGARYHLRCPAGTLVSFPLPFSQQDALFDVVEVPTASGYFFVVKITYDAHKGFGNEYRVAELIPYCRVGAPEDAYRRELLDCLVQVDGDLGP